MIKDECKLKIHLILEGNEEETFFTIIRDSRLKCEEIDLTFKNAGGAGNIAKHYQAAINKDYDLVLCVFDGDYKTSDIYLTYSKTIENLELVVGDKDKVKLISLISNPSILIWILLGVGSIDDLKELKVNKKDNSEILNKYFKDIGKSYLVNKKSGKPYDAEEWQLDTIKFHFENNKDCIDRLISNIDKVPTYINDSEPCSNLGEFIRAIGDASEIMKYIKNNNIF